MFTTECPRCGRELDVSQTECPNCTSNKGQLGSATTAPSTQVRLEANRPKKELSRNSPTKLGSTQDDLKPPWRRASTFRWILSASVLVIIGAWFYHSNGEWRASSDPCAENTCEIFNDPMTALEGNLEVTGLRTWWDLETETIRVRAVVINHGETSYLGKHEVSLRSVTDHPSTEAIAKFSLLITKALEPREARDMEVQLMSLVHPSVLPKRTEQHIVLEKLIP
ncbi:MAG: hypothetical protein CMN58_03040 [Solibacterales bacterium]|nr:hypothetical protein [Bryobacterales bacterium]|tara:strand:- start:13092 stop:13763 length:672 start_codon:yes stop_codon:yes gene_type:complete